MSLDIAPLQMMHGNTVQATYMLTILPIILSRISFKIYLLAIPKITQ